TLQYGRRVWIPPKSRIQSWHPALIPTEVSDGGKRANLQTLVLHADQTSEILIHSGSGRLQFDGTVRVTQASPMVGIIDILKYTTVKEETAPVDLLIAAESGEVPNCQNTYLADRIFAPGEESLHALDQLVIAEGRVVDD